MSGRKRLIHVLLVLVILGTAAIVGLLVRYYTIRSKFTWINLENLNPDEQYRLVRKIIYYKSIDGHRTDMRTAWRSDLSLTQFIPPKILDIMYPSAYSHENLVRQRKHIEPLLRRIARETHWNLYFGYGYDEAAAIDEIIEAYRNGKIDGLRFVVTLKRYLPIPSKALPDYENKEEVDSWIESQLCSKSYEELCLNFLDELMKAKTAEGGLGWNHVRLVRWLNRIYEYDLDEWLADKAPDALVFRNRELNKGYDPAIEFYSFVTNLHFGMIDEGIKAVFVDKNDQKACHQLIEVVYSDYYDSPNLCPPTRPWRDDWKNRLREWYWNNRDNLTYDFEKHRFVVKETNQ